VVGARWHNNRITVMDGVFLIAIEDELGLALLYPEELIDV